MTENTIDKGPCPTCGTPNAVDLTDGWTTRLDDLYAERCAGETWMLDRAVELLREMAGDEIIEQDDLSDGFLAAADLLEKRLR